MPKDNLRDKLEGNELDLSLNNLTTVPVKELAALPKATHLDLSCNSIVTLPENFCTLTYLVKIDLSKNELTELPDHIGALHNLQHLDLLGNKLCMLPVSFYQLRKLKWLDLKDNPLTEELKKVAGDCLDEMQCKKCAQRVIEYMKKINSELERIRQKKLQEEREKEEAIKAAEEATIREKREQRKAEKERKKKEKQESAKRERQNSKGDTAKIISQPEANGKIDNKKSSTQDHKRSSVWSLLIAVLVASIAVVVGVYVFCDSYADQRMCIQYWKPFLNETSQRFTQIHKQGAVLIERLVNMTKS